MMIVKQSFDLKRWVQSPEWLWSFVVAVGFFLLMYLLNALFSEINPANWWGLTYGTIASLLMGGAALLGIRRRSMNLAAKMNLGKSQVWLQFHLYAGTLSLLLVFMHSGFHIPMGAMNWWLWFLSIWVTVSGLVGVFIQKVIPRILSSALSIEVLYDRIPELVSEIREAAEKLVETCTDPIKDFYRKNVAAALVSPQSRLIYYVDITGGIQSRIRQFEYLRRVLSMEEKNKLDNLESMYRTKLEIDAHYTLQKALRWCLYTHVPISLVLLVLIILHIYAVLYY
ncbi:MAG: hypothetical protein HY707_14560 [Ignavibacteriae bacterium]|nr:hypothetical protein [Ignavibacteriota bacterium]